MYMFAPSMHYHRVENKSLQDNYTIEVQLVSSPLAPAPLASPLAPVLQRYHAQPASQKQQLNNQP